MRRLVTVGVLLLCACRAEPPPSEEEPVVPPDAGHLSPTELARLHFERVPDSVKIRHGACPFECCVYGEWRAGTQIPVLQQPDTNAAVEFTLEPDAPFVADTGYVHVLGPGIVIVDDTVMHHVDSRVQFVPGDTLVVLDYVGEGYWNLWHRGQVIPEVPGFWGAEVDSPRGAYYGDYRKEWWVHVRAADGRAGWFRADSTFRFSGADACAAP